MLVSVPAGAVWNIKEGTVVTNNHSGGGNGGMSNVAGTVNMSGGLFCSNTGHNCNGVIFMTYPSTINMSGGTICHNVASSGEKNGWNGVFYIYGNGGKLLNHAGTYSDYTDALSHLDAGFGDNKNGTWTVGSTSHAISTTARRKACPSSMWAATATASADRRQRHAADVAGACAGKCRNACEYMAQSNKLIQNPPAFLYQLEESGGNLFLNHYRTQRLQPISHRQPAALRTHSAASSATGVLSPVAGTEASGAGSSGAGGSGA